ncbi:t18348probable pol truncated-rice blast fungus magnaporthe gypsy retrotransposon [Lasallia pustulata]|uniref:T18348probable pol truncated-rice blast fungus magnaporthe gypsy retrotransposon n=1 Tax=Lasallia pustulata TaxID=136370 RepID=A0A1W5D1L6_9LECA|nr:t18348probable pol truncated-rice blast fungus magnaporthe gypsy retrotransposon [Lasallia pustulata]
MSGCKFITKFDIIAAFNKLRMDPGSKDLTTFITSTGLYKYRVLPFGLTNRPASYQHYMNDILLPYLNDFVQANVDDIIIYSKTRKEHIQHVQTVLGKLHEAGLQMDIKKSKFFVQETTFLGLVISTEGLKMDPQKIEVIA